MNGNELTSTTGKRKPQTALRRQLRLLGYARPYARGWVLILVLTLFASGFALLQPWPMKILVDRLLDSEAASTRLDEVLDRLPGGGNPYGVIGYVAAAGLVIFAVNSTLDVAITCVWIRVGQGMVYRLAGDLFARIQRRSLLFHSRNAVGDSLGRVATDSWCVNTLVETIVLTPLQELLFVGGVAVVMFRLDPQMAVVSFVAAPAMALTVVAVGRQIRKVATEQRQVETHIQSHVQQTLRGVQVVQAFGQEDREHGRFRTLARDAVRVQRHGAALRSLSDLGTGLPLTLGAGAVLLIGAGRVIDGPLTVGALLVFLSYSNSLQNRLVKLGNTYLSLQNLQAQVDRVSEVFESESEVCDAPGALAVPTSRGSVRVEEATFGYEPGRPVLKNVTLEAEPGQTVAIVGPTGAGKSTLVGLVPRFFDPWSGQVSLDGRDLRSLRVRDVRSQISLVLQEPFLFPLSIAENIAYGRPEASRDEIEAAAKAANAHAFIEQLPADYETLVGERGMTLSGGERQRVSIARALLKDAPVLILDEPTSALDAETESLLMQALRRLMEGRTTFVIAHRLSTIRRADVIAVLDAGQIVEQGNHDELVRSGGLYSRLHAIQTGTQHDCALNGIGSKAESKFEAGLSSTGIR